MRIALTEDPGSISNVQILARITSPGIVGQFASSHPLQIRDLLFVLKPCSCSLRLRRLPQPVTRFRHTSSTHMHAMHHVIHTTQLALLLSCPAEGSLSYALPLLRVMLSVLAVANRLRGMPAGDPEAAACHRLQLCCQGCRCNTQPARWSD
jgi:hypothetical protein